MAYVENDQLIIRLNQVDGSTLKTIQEALILGIEKISESETAGAEDHKNSIFWLSNILRASLLDESQTNIGLGGKAYKKVAEDA
jgi:hypothetical protein